MGKKVKKYNRGQLGDMTMVIAFFFLLLVISTGIVAGTYMFFSKNYEFREVDARILNKNIRECIKTQDINWNNEDKKILENEFYSKCNINISSVGNSWFIQIKNGEKEILDLGKGNEVECGLAEKNPKYMRCVNSNLKINLNGKDYDFLINTGSNQIGKEKLA